MQSNPDSTKKADGSEEAVRVPPPHGLWLGSIGQHLGAALLLALHALLAYGGAMNKSLTYDETAHLPAGISYWRMGDPRLNPEHPPLMKVIAAAPLAGLGVKLDTANPHWIKAASWRNRIRQEGVTESNSAGLAASINEQWQFGRDFLYRDNKAIFETMIRRSRCAMIGVSVMAGIVLYLWGWQLFGGAGALIALAFYSLSPDLVAHAPLANTDVGYMLFNTLTLAALFFHIPRIHTLQGEIALLFILVLGLAGMFLTRYSAGATLSFFFPALGFAAAFQPVKTIPQYLLRKICGLGTAFAAAVILTLIFYYSLFGKSTYWEGIRLVSHSVLIPANASYFALGNWSSHRMDYFLICLACKMTIPAVLAFTLWIGFAIFGRRPREFFTLYIALFLIQFAAIVSINYPNRGVRYLFPAYPLIFLAIGWLFARTGRKIRWTVAACLILHAISSLAAFPNYLAYMNEGARAIGKERLLGDSNLDWGQDLPALRDYLRRNQINSIKGLILTTADLSYYGISIETPTLNDLENSPAGTKIVFSIHALQGQKPRVRELLERWRLIEKLNDTIYIYEKPN